MFLFNSFFLTYICFGADTFENIWAKTWKISLNGSIIVQCTVDYIVASLVLRSGLKCVNGLKSIYFGELKNNCYPIFQTELSGRTEKMHQSIKC